MALISKKLGQFKQWTGEVFGSAGKTEASEDFKQLEIATETRKEGIENMHASLAAYATTLDGKDPDKKLPTISTGDKKMPCLSGLGKALVQQGRLQGEDNSYGLALLRIGESQNELSAVQLELVSKVRQGFLFDVGEILTAVQDFDRLQKKLENRRLDYDAKQNKLNKSKKEKPSLEEETKAAHYKYEETYNDLISLMSRFGEREESLLGSLVEFAHIQAQFFERGNEIAKKMVATLTEAGLEPKPRNYGLMKNSSFTDSLGKRSSVSSIGKINPPADVKQITGPAAMANSPHDDRREDEQKPKANTEKRDSKVICRVRALYAFKAENDGDLEFPKGEIISVTEEIDENWWSGEIQEDDGTIKKGIFPVNYVEKLTNIPSDNASSGIEMPAGLSAAGLSQEAMSQMKSVMPAGSVSDITAAITSVKLKSSADRKSSKPQTQAPAATAQAAVCACSTCGCDDFHPNAFKKGQCNMCFHAH